ncbi:MAG: hypothetical protein U0229_22015 [Anaeromyxobacter sp.]
MRAPRLMPLALLALGACSLRFDPGEYEPKACEEDPCTLQVSASDPDSACRQGRVSCPTRACVDSGAAVENGRVCGTSKICSDGRCLACVDGAPCQPPGDTARCHLGAMNCATGVCVDTGVLASAGSTCGPDQVCDAAGACKACRAGAACSEGMGACDSGAISCATGAPVCQRVGAALDGATCAPGKVCAAGACVTCAEGAACQPTSNPCHVGAARCATATCADQSTSQPDGTPCGTNAVCKDGACKACVAGLTCALSGPGQNRCHKGVTSCASGEQVCTDTGESLANGSACGTDQVCFEGACGLCAKDAPCTPQSAPCHAGLIACASGLPVCNDTLANAAPGTSCGTNKVCNGAGVCGDCTAGVACTPTNKCHTGLTSCGSGTSVCVDQGANVAAGTSCGTNQVCSPTGSCISCTPGASCSTNPNACRSGTVACSTGAVVCQDGANRADGTGCGANKVCSAGTCVDCVAGSACTPQNPIACRTYSTSCTTGPVCSASGNQPNGTTCGQDQVCNGGSCVGCVAGGACAPSNPCRLGAYSCATGAQVCVAGGPDPAKEGQACGVSPQGTCTNGECACPAGTTFWQGNCETCPGYTVSSFYGTLTAYVDAGMGLDNACCGRSSLVGSLGGPCRTLGTALANIPASGFTVSVVGDASKNASDSEAYPIRIGGGVAIWGPQNDTVYFPGSPGKDVFRVDVDSVEVAFYNLTAGRRASGAPGGASAGLYVGASGVAFPANNFTVDGTDRGIVVDGGELRIGVGGTVTIRRAVTDAVVCRSETNSILTSRILTRASTAQGRLALESAGNRLLYASTNCVVGQHPTPLVSPALILGPETGACTTPRPFQFGIYAEGNADIYVSVLHARCAGVDGVSLRQNGALAVNAPIVTIGSEAGGTFIDSYVTDSGCAGLYAEVGTARVFRTAFLRNQWGVYQSSLLESSAPGSQLIDLTGRDLSGARSHPNTLACNARSGAGLCALAGQGGDVWNQSGLPLLAPNNYWDHSPLSRCQACDTNLQSCACTGAAFGLTTPPDGVDVVTSKFNASSSSVGNVDVSGNLVLTTGACP